MTKKKLQPLAGTTLLTVATQDGIIMAADDLVYAEKSGQPIPRFNGVQKIFIAAKNILIGSAGVMSNPHIKYKFDDWIAGFIEDHRSGDTLKLPSLIAESLHKKIRETFEPIETSPETGGWQTCKPGEWLASYIIAGYSESFQQSYFFEIGAQVNLNCDGLVYPSPSRKRTDNFFVGEDEFYLQALRGIEPQQSEWVTIQAIVEPTVLASLPKAPGALQKLIVSMVSLIKVEAQFNPKKVGTGVRVGVIERQKRTAYVATF